MLKILQSFYKVFGISVKECTLSLDPSESGAGGGKLGRNTNSFPDDAFCSEDLIQSTRAEGFRKQHF